MDSLTMMIKPLQLLEKRKERKCLNHLHLPRTRKALVRGSYYIHFIIIIIIFVCSEETMAALCTMSNSSNGSSDECIHILTITSYNYYYI